MPCGSVRDLAELFADPQVAAREMIARVEHQTVGALQLLGTPLKLSATPGGVRTAPPVLGAHTDAVLAGDLGLGSDQIGALRVKGIV